MDATAEALASFDGIRSLLIEGKTLNADLAAVIEDVIVERSIDGTSTLTITCFDREMALLKSGIFNTEVRVQVDDFAFGLAQVKKSGDNLNLLFEDLPVFTLKKHDTPIKVEKKTITHVDFVRRLVAEEPWLKLVAPYGVAQPLTKGSISRGTPDSTKTDADGNTTHTDAKKEDTWAAIGRIGEARGWRRFVRGTNEIWYVPEPYLIAQAPVASITQDSRLGVDNIDFDVDTGKPVATGTVTARMGRWGVPVGACITLTDLGPASGAWLVSTISRSLFNPLISISIAQPNPILPEPDGDGQDAVSGTVDAGATGDTAPQPIVTAFGTIEYPADPSLSNQSDWGSIWPVVGTVHKDGEFGVQRSHPHPHKHEGIDILVDVGTPVHATKKGTVVGVKRNNGAAGNMVTIQHDSNIKSIYMHLSKFMCTNGKAVETGEVIGLSGGKPGADGSGDATAPHLHFEIRVGGEAVNPRKYLPEVML